MPSPLTSQIAIIGSGPAGCYLAQSLLRGLPGSSITLFDRLVSPFGLIRYGIAADHQHTKAITRQFERLFQSDAVRFAGNIEVGRDVSLDELREHFDAVVLASGLTSDRALGVTGDTLNGVIGAGEITRTLNSHPDAAASIAPLGTDVVIVGAGNVALDILRFLVKGAGDYDGSDVSEAALTDYLAAPAQRITLVSRSSPADSKGDPQMLKELAALHRAQYKSPHALASSGDLDRVAAARVAAFTELSSPERQDYPGPSVSLRFGLTPTEVLGQQHVEAVTFQDAGGARETVPASAVITAIGFDPGTARLSDALAESSNSGRVAPGLYRTGWAKRGPRGAIPENRACAKSVADELISDLETGALQVPSGKRGFEALSETVRLRATSYAEWLVLDAHEREHAPADRVRRKVPDHNLMAEVARGLALSHQS